MEKDYKKILLYNTRDIVPDVVKQEAEEAYVGTRVKIVVSNGPEIRPSPEYYSQKIVLKTKGSYATMGLFTWNGKEWESQFYTSNVRIGEMEQGIIMVKVERLHLKELIILVFVTV